MTFNEMHEEVATQVLLSYKELEIQVPFGAGVQVAADLVERANPLMAEKVLCDLMTEAYMMGVRDGDS